MRLSCTQQTTRERFGQEHQVSPATQALPLPSHQRQPRGELQHVTLGSTGRPRPSTPEHHPVPASSAAGSLQHHSPLHQLHFGGYSCFSSQQSSCAALQQPLYSTFACKGFRPPPLRLREAWRQGPPGQGSRDKAIRGSKVPACGCLALLGQMFDKTPPSPFQHRVAHPAGVPTMHPSHPRLPHSRQELPGAGCFTVISLQVCTSCLEVGAGKGPGKPRWL